MNVSRQTRGRPLLALIAMMVAWTGLRAAYWEAMELSGAASPYFASLRQDGFAPAQGPSTVTRAVASGPVSMPGEGYDAYLAEFHDGSGAGPIHPRERMQQDWRGVLDPYRNPHGDAARESPVILQGFWPGAGRLDALGDAAVLQPAARLVPVRTVLAHQFMWMAAVSRMPLPPAMFSNFEGDRASLLAAGPDPQSGTRDRWSLDSWLLHRKGGRVSLASGILPATYGASQYGAVLRYRLAPDSRLRPAAYLRMTSALNGSQEREAALGLSTRPLKGVPIAAAAELRATSRPGSSMLRPAVLAWTEIPPFPLPMGARGEFYAQAGYIGGKFKTGFADGQMRADRKLAGLGRAELRAGAGIWAGAQKGASRLDMGPSATLGMPISNSVSARLGLDWRFRVTGNAQPKSGPAVSLSAGF